MLATIRDKATGWIAGVIVGLLIISFAFWGVSFYSGQSAELNVAQVNGNDISFQSFQRSYSQLRKQMQSVMGDVLSLEEESLIKDQTINKLIDSELVNQLVVDSDLNITNSKLVESIKNIEYFSNEGSFDREKYERSITSIGMAPTIFEAQLRMDLLSEQLQAGFAETVFVLEPELKNILRLEAQSRDISYTILSHASFIEDGEIDEGTVENFYKENSNYFSDPEQVKISYIELNVKDIAENVETDEESLRIYYDNNKDDYDVAEQRSVRKLFIRTGKDVSAEYKEKAKVVINSALSLVNDGISFETIVEKADEKEAILEFSEHLFMSKGIMGKEIDEFLFSADEGATSEIIETKDGYNIVKILEVRGGPKNKYENSAEKVMEDYKISKAEEEFFELADQLTTLAYENPETLQIAADAIGREIQTSDYFARDNKDEVLTSDPRVISKSFDPDLINSENNSDVIELSDDHIIVLRVDEHKESTIKPLDEVADEVIARIRIDLAKNKVKTVGSLIVDELKSGVDPDMLNSYSDIEWISIEKVKRDDVSVNRAVLRAIFESEKPIDNKPVIASKLLGSGDYAVIIISNSHEEISEIDEELEASTDLKLRRVYGTNEWQYLLRDTRENAKINIFKDNI